MSCRHEWCARTVLNTLQLLKPGVLVVTPGDRDDIILAVSLSGYRTGVRPGAHVAGSADGLQIIQDTGSGGSWPVSTDRMSWAFGADEALKALPPAQRQAFAATALKALSNTLDNDRLAVNNARVEYSDELTGKQFSAESIQLSTGPVHEATSILKV